MINNREANSACDVSEEQLWSWVDRQAPELEAHLKQCPRCRALAEEHEQNVGRLRASSRPTVTPKGSERSGGTGSRSNNGRFRPGDQIGPYTILQKIGEGGFAYVYLAQQDEPFRRRVALKIIKRGMDSEQVLARFEAERQALAVMEHPNVAKVLDAGLTDAGRPYFTMEFVPGEPVTDYCDKHRLSNRERLELFLQICEAVQHAHHKGIIHRDIKPSNVLVTLPKDRRPEVKVIDFGVAKAMNQQLSEKTIFTEHGQLIGTPEYMSPEQAEMSRLDIDTRTDVYSLGVLLYELVVGALPFDPKTLRSRAYHEIVRIIREENPPRPSTKLSSLGDRSRDIAEKHHHATIRELELELRGDLDWITMMALEKDRTRRYDTPSEFAADIKRYLKDQPVLASPPSTGYRVRKFVKRNKGLVFATGAVAAALLIGITTTTSAMVLANSARADAEEAKIQAVAARTTAEQERDRAIKANEWSKRLAHHFIDDFHDSVAELPGTMKARNRLSEEATAFLSDYLMQLEQESDEAITIKRDIAWAHRRIGQILGGIRGPNQNQTAEAMMHFAEAVRIGEEVVAADPDHASAQLELASSHIAMGDVEARAKNRIEAREHCERALSIGRKMQQLNPADRKASRLVAIALLELGDLLFAIKEYEAAEPYFQESLALRRALAAEHDPGKTAQRDLSVGLSRMAALRQRQTNLPEAEQFAMELRAVREAELDLYEESARRRRDLMLAYQQLGDLYGSLEQYQRAVSMFDAARLIAADLHMTDPDDDRARSDYAGVLYRAGNAKYNLGDVQKDEQLKQQGLELNQQSAEMLTELIAAFPDDNRFVNTLTRVEGFIKHIKSDLAGDE